MKFRTDFVTNSSSSSFILGFRNEDEIPGVMRDSLPSYWSEDTISEIISDVEHNITSKEEALQFNRDYTYMPDVLFHGKHSWALSRAERNSSEYKELIDSILGENQEDLRKALNEYDVISIVKYEDHTRLGSELEHDVMPYLDNTIRHISHH